MTFNKLHKDWSIQEGQYLTRHHNFDSYEKALEAVAKIGALAEVHNHHPVLEVGWKYVEIRLWSHDVNAITDRDYMLAEAIDTECI